MNEFDWRHILLYKLAVATLKHQVSFSEPLMTQELKNNSKWVIGQTGSAPILDLRPEANANP